MEGGNVGSTSPGCMGMDLINKRAGMCKSHTDLSEV